MRCSKAVKKTDKKIMKAVGRDCVLEFCMSTVELLWVCTGVH